MTSAVVLGALLMSASAAFAAGAQDLRRAILNNDVAELGRLLQSGASANGFADDESALMSAARRGREEMVELLLKHGADARAKNRFGKTSLMSACESPSTKVVAALLRAGADANSRGANGETAYLYAARYSSPDVLETLEKAGADVNAKDQGSRGALLWAAIQSNESTVRYLIAKGADVNQMDGDRVSPLLGAKSDAVRRLLVESGADVRVVDHKGNTVLTNASHPGRLSVDIAKLLLDKGADVNARGSVDSGQTPLMYASWFAGGDAELVRLFVARGADVNAVDRYGRTALMQVNRKEIAAILIEAGADLQRRSHEGRTALGEAIYRGHLDVVDLFRQSGIPE